MSGVTINGPALDDTLSEVAHDALQRAAEFVASGARPLTPELSTRPPGRAEWDYSLPPGLLRDSIRGNAGRDAFGPVGRVWFATPLGWFRNVSGTGHAAYSQAPVAGRIPYYRRLKSGRRVLRFRRIKANAALFGRGRGDSRSIAIAIDALNGRTITKEGVV